MDYSVRTLEQLEPVLVAFRKKQGLTQAEMAQRTGVSQQALSALESKPHRASFERLLSYLSALNVEIILREKEPSVAHSSEEW
jgi:HTH-type transcriptional regulator/antitoxin HipB